MRWRLALLAGAAVVGWWGLRAASVSGPLVWICASVVAGQVAVALLRPAGKRFVPAD